MIQILKIIFLENFLVWLESKYQSRTYYLIFKNKYDDILHCQLARRKQFSKRELKDNNIIELDDNDYPYVNIFIELKSQKFLIESNTQVFENYNTCSKVIENIINNNLKDKDIRIESNYRRTKFLELLSWKIKSL